MNDSSLTLGDLLNDPALHLELVAGGPETRQRVISGAHSIELPHPVQWLEAGWIMLTTGLSWPTKDAQVELIEELSRAGVAALGFGVDVVFDEVPPAMREVADRLSFPLFAVPGPTAFKEVISSVQRQALSHEIRDYGRLAAMQRYLSGAFCESNPTDCVVERLSKLLDTDVALVARDGSVLAGACSAPPAVLTEHLSDGVHPHRVDSPALQGWVVPIDDGNGRSASWLVAGGTPGRHEHPLLKAATLAALPLLVATQRLTDARISEERAARRAVLDALLNVDNAPDAEIAAARAASWNVDPAEGVRAVIARPLGPVHPPASERLTQVMSVFETAGTPALVTIRDEEFHLLLPASVPTTSLERTLLEIEPRFVLGVGRVVYDGALVRASRADADLALRFSRASDSRCLCYDDLDLASTLVAETPAERIRPKIDQWLNLLMENPLAFETLTAYFDHDLDVGRTSRALHLHPNSTRYRLLRVEELLGVRLRRPATIAALHLALLARDYMGTGFTPTAAVDEPVRAVA